MATLNAKIVFTAAFEGAKRAFSALKQEIAVTTAALNKTDRQNVFGRTRTATESISAELRRVRTLALAAFGVQGAQGLANTIDGYASLSARLKIVTSSQAEFNAAQRELFDLAQANQQGLGEVTQLFTRLAPAFKQLGGTSRDALLATEAVALSLRVVGATGAEASSSIIQFSQAMGRGVSRERSPASGCQTTRSRLPSTEQMNQIRDISVSDVPDEARDPCLRAAKATLEQVNRDPVLRARFFIRYSQYCRRLSEDGALPSDWPLPRSAQMWREIEIARGEPAAA